jgi:hypothetical protein
MNNAFEKKRGLDVSHLIPITFQVSDISKRNLVPRQNRIDFLLTYFLRLFK